MSLSLLKENKANKIFARLSCPIEFWFQSYNAVLTPIDCLLVEEIPVVDVISVLEIKILLCNSLNFATSAGVNNVSSVLTVFSSASGTNRFKLRNIVGNCLYPSPLSLLPFRQKRTLGSPLRTILSISNRSPSSKNNDHSCSLGLSNMGERRNFSLKADR